MYNVKVGDCLIYLGDTNKYTGYTNNKKYKITFVDQFNGYFQSDDGLGVVFHLKDTYTDKDWLFVSNNDIRKQKLKKLLNV